MTETTQEPPQVIELGPDRLTISNQDIVIEAKHPFTDWEVRELNHVPMYVHDKKYYLVEKRRAEAPYAVRYLLKPWPEYQATNAVGFLNYDLEAVKERDSHVREGRLQELGRAFLIPFYPLLGFLWSGIQSRLTRFGFIPHAMTGFSVFAIFGFLFGQGVFAVIMLNSSLRVGKVMIGGFIRAIAPGDYLNVGPVAIPVAALDFFLVIVLLADVIVRYSHYLRDEQWCGGILEWLLPRSQRRGTVAPTSAATTQ